MKAHFSGPLKTQKVLYQERYKVLGLIPGTRTRQYWVVLEPFSLIDENGKGIDTLLKGFKTDFSSVPWGFRNLFPKDDVDAQAAVFHDWLYHKNKPNSVMNVPKEERMSREECDYWFLIGMEICGQPLAKRRIKYRAVRLGGWYGWNKKDKEVIGG